VGALASIAAFWAVTQTCRLYNGGTKLIVLQGFVKTATAGGVSDRSSVLWLKEIFYLNMGWPAKRFNQLVHFELRTGCGLSCFPTRSTRVTLAK
jgi:hypothetical protein